MRAARKAGELSKKIEKIDPKVSGGRGDLPRSKGEALSDAGISTQQASDWERLSDVPEDEFEAALSTKSVDSGSGHIDILQALDDPHLFGPFFKGPSWTAWRGF